MIKKINYRTGAKAAGDKPKRTSARLYTSTVEYSMIAGLVMQQYQKAHDVQFEALLSIPLEDRIPGLMEKYGKKTMHKLLLMVLKEFVASMAMPAYKRPTETRISITACEIMLSASEDYIALEDVILFLQRAKAGYYGAIKTLVNMQLVLQLMDRYRQERHQAYLKFVAGRETEFKHLGPVARTAPEPTQINDLFQQGLVVDMTKKMSG
jgi:hypothetical protein